MDINLFSRHLPVVTRQLPLGAPSSGLSCWKSGVLMKISTKTKKTMPPIVMRKTSFSKGEPSSLSGRSS